MGKKQVTFADIAEYTHFSKTTISRYFNHPDSLTLENQEKISRALDELGYKKNKLAKVLANGKSEFVGIIVPNLYLHYYSEMLTQLLATYTDYHYKFLIFMSDKGTAEEENYIDELLAYQIEGLIVLSHTLSSEKLASYHIPIVAIERESMHISSVTSDNYMGALQATSLLIRDKCDILIHINVDVPKYVPAYDRIRAFEDTCTEHNIPYELSLNVSGDSYNDLFSQMKVIFNNIDEKYPDKKDEIEQLSEEFLSEIEEMDTTVEDESDSEAMYDEKDTILLNQNHQIQAKCYYMVGNGLMGDRIDEIVRTF